MYAAAFGGYGPNELSRAYFARQVSEFCRFWHAQDNKTRWLLDAEQISPAAQRPSGPYYSDWRRLKQQPGELRGSLVETSLVSIGRINSLDQGEAFVWDLCALLGFATSSRVVAHSFQLGKEGRTRTVGGSYNSWRTPFVEPPMIADFVTQVWDRYRALKEQRALAGLFHMIAFSDARGAALETQIATSVLCIESIKSYFALSEGSRYGIIEAPNGTFKWVGGGNVNFQDLLEQTLDDVGMPLPASFARIKKLRDAIVHRGFIRETDAITKHIFGAVPPGAMYRTMFETMEDMQDLLREFVLRLLAYKGPYELYKDAGHVSKTLP